MPEATWTPTEMMTVAASRALRDNAVTFVGIGRQGPEISAGASGFRSNMSWCGGPPTR